jgi:DNA mismatch endonuclease (patch repair protein)
MQAIRRRDTRPEVAVRRLLHAAGHRYRVDLLLRMGSERVRPDIVFTKRRIAVFIDGCFWHVCLEHGRQPQVNDWYWAPKLAKNQDRDLRVTSALQQAGWLVLRFWEHESADHIAQVVAASVRAA